MIDLAHPLFADTKVLSEHCQRYGFIAPKWVIDTVDFITPTGKLKNSSFCTAVVPVRRIDSDHQERIGKDGFM